MAERRRCWAVYDYPGGPNCFCTAYRGQIRDNSRQEVVEMVELRPGERIVAVDEVLGKLEPGDVLLTAEQARRLLDALDDYRAAAGLDRVLELVTFDDLRALGVKP